MVVAHLNGGPKDDQEVALQELISEYNVAGTIRFTLEYPMGEATPIAYSIKMGRYELRRDENGQPVPHSLTAYSFDWQGWEE